jgi:hypothetical protein
VDDVAIFDRALSAEEVAAIARAGCVGAWLRRSETDVQVPPSNTVIWSRARRDFNMMIARTFARVHHRQHPASHA